MNEEILDDQLGKDRLSINQNARVQLYESRRWAKFLAIMGFISAGFMVLFAIGIGTFLGGLLSGMASESGLGMEGASNGFFISAIFFILAFFIGLPSYFMLKFSSFAAAALNSDNDEDLADALKYNNWVYKFYGIVTAIYWIFNILSIFVGLLAS